MDADEIEQSARTVTRAIELTAGIGSVRPGERIATVLRRLTPHRRLPVVGDLLQRLHD